MAMKTVGQKLFLNKGKTLKIISPPENVAELIGTHDATVLPEHSRDQAEVVLLFALNRTELESRLETTKLQVAPNGALWLAYPKRTSRLKSDIHRDTISEYAETLGLETVAIISINDVWSCLRLKVVA